MPTQPRLLPPSVSMPIPLPSSARAPDTAAEKASSQRLKTWDIPTAFHCSIIGTCLTNSELRQILLKAGQEDAKAATDHGLHGRGVRLAGQRDQAAKLLNKALDKRHEASIKRIPRQADETMLRRIWRESFDRGDIAGPYWALISHPATPPGLVRDIFGEVHMLSHLVGSASRLDIARLTRLERELEDEREKTARQETRLKVAAEERIALQQRIRHLEERAVQAEALAAHARRARQQETIPAGRTETDAPRSDALARRLAATEERCGALQRELEQLQDLSHSVLRENEALEAIVAAEDRHATKNVTTQTAGPVLYVGGRRNLFDHLRACAENRNVDLLLHDGGMEDSTTLLPALVGQAATVLFPVDHISHAAVGLVKRLCREQGKSYLPLRSAGLASFLAAITGAGGAYGRL
ncbi:DUF2325 domain-containing protein [Shinella sp. CPCC 101442]|uniref:DUF2325 domain-containing protein n=1 Tax=Shinella sp. CPCC 101442 TaxID=2932265 RepID=UPI0021530E20|nr:DUF2325 domain-containing protein [Shinella sp. CPCC 101442]MCR6497480.1 DUF2325 domain-containing protein [Shinella sp. CPCC 101442]